jgi:hypothetical protein
MSGVFDTVKDNTSIYTGIQDRTMQTRSRERAEYSKIGPVNRVVGKSSYRCGRWGLGLCNLGASAGRMCRAIFARARAS